MKNETKIKGDKNFVFKELRIQKLTSRIEIKIYQIDRFIHGLG